MRKPKVLKMSGEKGSPSSQKGRRTLPWEKYPEEYVYRIDVAGVGGKTDRIAVFIEKERLDNF